MSVVMEKKSSNSLLDVLCKDHWTLEDIEFFLERDSSSINQKYSDGGTPLHIVLRHKNCSSDIVQLLLKYGADVHCKDVLGQTPLLAAVKHSRGDAIVMALIENGADVRAVDKIGWSSLCVALRYKATKNIIETLLRKGCPMNECHYHCGSVLHCLVDRPSLVLCPDIFNMLIQRGADVNAFDNQGRSVFCFALQMGCEARSIRMLMDAGGLLRSCIKHGSPLNCAAIFGNPFKNEVVDLLVKSGASVDQVDDQGLIPLQHALRTADYETKAIEMLLDCHKGMDLNSLVDNKSNSLLHLAVFNKYYKLRAVKLLVQRGVKVDKVNSEGESPLNTAVTNRGCKPSLIKFLLKNGAQVQAVSMEFAVKYTSDVEILKLLWVASSMTHGTSSRSILKQVLSIKLCSHRQVRRSLQLACFKFLVRVYLLHVSDYCLPFFNSDHCCNQEILKYRDQCVPELLSLKSKDVGQGHTLHDFLRMCNSPFEPAENREEMYDFDQLLKVMANNAFPLYFDIIAYTVGKGLMKAKLQNVRMCAPKYSSTKALAKEIVLPYDVMLKISHYLQKEDLMRLILASLNVQDSEVNKRRAELSELQLCCKFPRLNKNEAI